LYFFTHPHTPQVNQPVLQVRAVQKQSIMNYSFGQQSVFLRIVIALPSLMAPLRRILEQGAGVQGGVKGAAKNFGRE
jgi:hypothetical protein